ncbi:uncharacterized protein LOC109846501 isoform X2 [Asparagus officinalis]|uniref:uncharacterized protein LOC109846501 isoform X2 n=1 Tax=Asparagus officinalis TaxID=4686 RepID=UPI00098E2E28|nr:uncharacterized protein LOC109846501 isoform X2 [Asparagus officinalis]
MRLRFNQAYNSSGEDLEDDACSRTPTAAAAEVSLPVVRRARTWPELAENLVWVLSAVFIIYFGDWEVNMISLLWADARIRRAALHLGLASAILNVGVVVYTTYFLSSCPPKSSEKSEVLSSAAPLLIVLGFISFCLLSYALWPIWNVLTIPLLVTFSLMLLFL